MIHPSVLKKQKIIIGILLVLTGITMVLSLGLGRSSVSFDRILPILLGDGTFKEEFVFYSIRLPRIVVTLLAGMALAVSGAILQGITRNDLADPGIIGINSGAGVGVAVFFLFFPVEAGSLIYLLPVVAFLSGILTAILLYLFSYQKGAGLQPAV